ncbi:MAG: flavin-containing monooxygenase [Corynebacterium sp.]|uniref:flavin-containing monooxygenase n=1 Tax=unclassified Corynebacterium TaxID=2624378 RepID=UPI0026484F64|nr:NAD(P)/FAD-dependent oxidoreductase [Corynebacterium sp.]
MTTTEPTEPTGTTDSTVLDLLIVGAGVAGIDLAHHVVDEFPGWNWRIVDSNDDLGGTWNTFTYPGIRSDSDMASFGLPYRHWPHKGTLGEGADIREYLRDAARDDGVLQRIQLRTWVKRANFVTTGPAAEAHGPHWEVTTVRAWRHGPDDRSDATDADRAETLTRTRRLHLACGYYDHRAGFQPHFDGEEDFDGQLVHAQQWRPEEQGDVAGRRIVIIGSGATAVTLLPALAQKGADVTMLQRTPTWVAALPRFDTITTIWASLIPNKRLAYKVARANHITRDMVQWYLAKGTPFLFSGFLHALQLRWLSPSQIRRDFTPPYRPWAQRVCKAPGGDIFAAIKDGGAKVVTATIDRLVPQGVRLQDGTVLEADTVIAATGLQLQLFGGAELTVDDAPVGLPDTVAYRGVLISGLPNLSFTVGYLNQSWTTRADLTARYMVRLWHHMVNRGESLAAPVFPGSDVERRALLEFDAGYIKRSQHVTPRQGDRSPWLYRQDYLREWPELARGDLTEEMVFDDAAVAVARALPASTAQAVSPGPTGSHDAAPTT